MDNWRLCGWWLVVGGFTQSGVWVFVFWVTVGWLMRERKNQSETPKRKNTGLVGPYFDTCIAALVDLLLRADSQRASFRVRKLPGTTRDNFEGKEAWGHLFKPWWRRKLEAPPQKQKVFDTQGMA